MKNLVPFLLLAVLLINTSCEYDSQSDLIEVTDVTTVTYTNTIKSIIDTNCIGCHNSPPVNGAPFSLLTYENVTSAITNNGLLDRISSTDLAFLMPAGGPRLPQNTIDIITQWNTDGLTE